MAGNLAVSLIEILAYLIPGGLVLGTAVYLYAPALEDRLSSGALKQLVFISLSYIVGHLLTLFSILFAKLRSGVNLICGVRQREKRIPYYSYLRAKLQSFFGLSLDKDEEYYFALRLVTEYQPRASQTIDRLYALTLFARNASLAFWVIACLCVQASWIAVIAFVVLGALFFLRYIQLESAAANTVLRAAYVYLCSKDNNGKDVDAGNA